MCMLFPNGFVGTDSESEREVLIAKRPVNSYPPSFPPRQLSRWKIFLFLSLLAVFSATGTCI